MIRIIVTLTLTLLALNIDAQTATGRIYADINSNGKPDKGEKGLPAVAVSNGKDVVLTDSKGFYQIQAPESGFIFVIKPAGFKLPVNQYNLPQFYYRHYPAGSPMLKLPSIRPTGPLPEEINFGLIPVKEKDQFKALIMGDTQVKNLDEVGYLSRDIIAEPAVSDQFVFVTVLGDVVHDNFELYSPVNKVLSALHVPLYNVAGNHDINYNATRDDLSNTSFETVYGPRTYAFNYAKVHFVVLDNIIYSGDTVRRRYTDGFDDTVLEFLKNDLRNVSKDNLVVLMMHAPFIRSYSREGIQNLDKLLAELSVFPHTFSISGHDHAVSQQIITSKYGWNREPAHQHFNTGTVCGDWWQGTFDDTGLPDAMMYDGTPNGYSVLNISGNTYTVDYKVARGPADYQMNIFIPPVLQSDSPAATPGEVVVNFFTGSENDSLYLRFDGGDWVKMEYAIMPDPVFANQRKLWENTALKMEGRMPSRAMPSRHIWKAPLPQKTGAGIHEIEVRAVDLFQREHRAVQFFRVE